VSLWFLGSSIRNRYTRTIIVVVTCTLVLGGGLQAWLNYRQAEKLTRELQQLEAKVVATKIEGFFADINTALVVIARMPWEHGAMRSSEKLGEFEALLRRVPAVSEVSWCDEDGVERVRLSRTRADKISVVSAQNMPTAKDAISTKPTVVGDVFLLDGLDFNVLVALEDIYVGGGTTYAAVNLRFVSSLVENLKIGHTGISYVADNSGKIIAHPNIAIVMRQGEMVRGQVQSSPETVADLRSFNSLGLREAKPSISSFVPISGTSWRVVVEQDSSEVLTMVYSELIQTGLLLLLALGLALFAARTLSIRIVRPLETLESEVNKIASGDLSARATANSTGEISRLAGSFNHMADHPTPRP
jgi:HAMP domain-containing protein